MDFLEHDLKTLQEDMLDGFSPSEIKTLLLQLTSAVEYLHSNWILHRDLKTSNLLMNNRGQMKVADFGMARYYGDPPPKLTQLVVTLWYRAPELLLGAEKYGAEIDLWSVGCIFGELLTKQPLLQGKNEVDQLAKVAHSQNSDLLDTLLTIPDIRTLWYPYGSDLARLQTSTQRPLTASTKHLPNHRRCNTCEISTSHKCWHYPSDIPLIAQSSTETNCQRGTHPSLF